MGLALPHELTVPMSWLGLIWPEADEDLLEEAGQKWIAFGTQLARAAEPAHHAAEQVWTSTEGSAAIAFETWWTQDDGPKRRLSDDAKAALLIGGALLAFAAITLAVKLSIIAQLIVLAAEVAQAIATAFVTVGATTAEIPGFVVASRILVRRLLDTLVHHAQTVIRGIFNQARNLLRRGARVGARDLRSVVSHPHGLTSRDVRALADYTGDGYHDLNPALRSGRPLTPEIQQRVDDVSSALGKLPPHHGPVWRGTDLTDHQLSAYRPGAVVHHPGFESSSSNPASAFEGNTRFLINSANGKDVSAFSKYPESEVLFDHGTSFRILDHRFDAATGTHHIYMTEVP